MTFACAYALMENSKIPRVFRFTIEIFVTIPVGVPAALMGFGILFAYTQPPLELYGTTTIIVIAYVTLMLGYATRLQFATLLATGQEFLEASKACGAGPLRSLIFILLPMARRGMIAASALTFVLLSHEFSASMMVRSIQTQVMGSVLYDSWSSGIYPEAAVLAILMVVVTFGGVIVAVSVGGVDSLKRL